MGRFVGENQNALGALPAVLHEVHRGATVYGEECPALVSAQLQSNSGL